MTPAPAASSTGCGASSTAAWRASSTDGSPFPRAGTASSGVRGASVPARVDSWRGRGPAATTPPEPSRGRGTSPGGALGGSLPAGGAVLEDPGGGGGGGAGAMGVGAGASAVDARPARDSAGIQMGRGGETPPPVDGPDSPATTGTNWDGFAQITSGGIAVERTLSFERGDAVF